MELRIALNEIKKEFSKSKIDLESTKIRNVIEELDRMTNNPVYITEGQKGALKNIILDISRSGNDIGGSLQRKLQPTASWLNTCKKS